MSWQGGGGTAGRLRSPEETALRRETWKVGWMFMEAGRFKQTEDGLMILES